MTAESSVPVAPRTAALAALVCLVPVMVAIATAPDAGWGEFVGIVYHLTLFFLVPGLRAPDWAKMAGYGWLLLDVTTGVLRIHHVPHEVADPVRLGSHIFAGIWIATASSHGSRPMKFIGIPAGAWLSIYSFVSPFLPMSALAPASALVFAWLVLIAWQNGSQPPSQHPSMDSAALGSP